jgi:hypothetical protein
MNKNIESESSHLPAEGEYHYPWLRTVMLIVVYGALMVFLWHFPSEGGRTFFRTLFRGLLYVLAGVGVVGVTLVLLLFVLPSLPVPPEEEDEDWNDEEDWDDEDYEDEGVYISTVIPARSLYVSAFKKRETEPQVWNVLYELEDELECIILADAFSGIIAVTEVGGAAANDNIRMIRERLKRAGFSVRNPH